MADFKILMIFKDKIIEFFDELISYFPEEGDLLVMRIFFKSQIPMADAMRVFSTQINQNDQLLKIMVENRNDKFFLEHNLFDVFGKDKVGHFKNLWLSNKLDSDTRETIWIWIDFFVNLTDKYTKITQQNKTCK